MFDFEDDLCDELSDTLPGDYAEMFQQIYHDMNKIEVIPYEVDSESVLEWHYKN